MEGEIKKKKDKREGYILPDLLLIVVTMDKILEDRFMHVLRTENWLREMGGPDDPLRGAGKQPQIASSPLPNSNHDLAGGQNGRGKRASKFVAVAFVVVGISAVVYAVVKGKKDTED